MRTLAATLLICALAASPALAVTHKATGFGVEPPFPFSAQPIPYPGSEVAFGIVSMTRPTPPDGDPYLCLIGFNLTGPLTRALGQAGINELAASEEFRAMTLASVSAHFEVSSSAVFDEHGMTGLEMIGTPRGREGGADVRIFISQFSSTLGSVSMSCATTADQIDSATEVFRTLRHTIILPTEPE
jgi:hypothetical protein